MTTPRDEDTLHLTVLGQALIQHDLRAEAWPDSGGFSHYTRMSAYYPLERILTGIANGRCGA
jgi:hypothetical protein